VLHSARYVALRWAYRQQPQRSTNVTAINNVSVMFFGELCCCCCCCCWQHT